jgi:hemerythrin superfamily protein
VIDVLLAQHARVEELFRAVLSSTGDARRDSFEELVHLLAVHETAEEEVVHPLARGSIDAGDAVVDARLAEEREAKEILKRLFELGPQAPEFDAEIRRFRIAVLEHAKREERYEFPHLRAAHSPVKLRALATALKAAEATAPTRPHPGVESAKANLLLGPPAAVMDRVRDLLRKAMRD